VRADVTSADHDFPADLPPGSGPVRPWGRTILVNRLPREGAGGEKIRRQQSESASVIDAAVRIDTASRDSPVALPSMVLDAPTSGRVAV